MFTKGVRMKGIVMGVVLFCFVFVAYAQGSFSAVQIQRIKVFKQRLGAVDKKSLEKTISELQKARDSEAALQIQEVIAQVYADIVAEQDIRDQATQEWLYGMVALNMANLQFGGRSRDSVSQMIVQKLKKALPAALLAHPDFHVSVE